MAKTNNQNTTDRQRKMPEIVSYEDFKSGKKQIHSIAQVKMEFIKKYCLDDNEDAARWFYYFQDEKFMKIRSEFCNKFLGIKSKTSGSSLTVADVKKALNEKYHFEE